MKLLDEQLEIFDQQYEFIMERFGSNNTASLEFAKDHLTEVYDRESTQLLSEVKALYQTLEEIESLVVGYNSREKRAIIPIIGSLLSSLFGVSTHSDFNSLKKSIDSVRSSQEQVIHVVQESITLINSTHQQAAENREAIDQLISATGYLSYSLKQMFDSFDALSKTVDLVQLMMRLNEIFDMMSLYLSKAHFELEHLTNQFLATSQHRMSFALIQPSQFQKVLVEISDSLPPYLTLPFGTHKTDILNYYDMLQPLIFTSGGMFYATVAIPIVATQSGYDLYKIVNLPVPQPDSALSAKYDLNSDYFVISKNGVTYTLISNEEAILCKGSPICKLSAPAYKLDRSPSCASALYLKQFKM